LFEGFMQKVAELEADPGLKRPVVQSAAACRIGPRKRTYKERPMGNCGDELVVMNTSGLTDADWAVITSF